MHFLYIIYSKQSNKFYIGETQNVQKRVLMHNQHYRLFLFADLRDFKDFYQDLPVSSFHSYQHSKFVTL
ncbi:GIY-YIG nuclease family protein [Psychroflexus gondwanensis]|uniref:GIY-YIG nuclease family protein n=1 Tax=Psychroflexus gondwanensis TaxID=251 RepID=UPI0009D95274